MSRSDEIKRQILDLVQAYHEASFGHEAFVPGETAVPVSGKVFDAAELINLVDSSLEFWLTTGRYAEQFEREFARNLGVRHASLHVVPVETDMVRHAHEEGPGREHAHSRPTT